MTSSLTRPAEKMNALGTVVDLDPVTFEGRVRSEERIGSTSTATPISISIGDQRSRNQSFKSQNEYKSKTSKITTALIQETKEGQEIVEVVDRRQDETETDSQSNKMSGNDDGARDGSTEVEQRETTKHTTDSSIPPPNNSNNINNNQNNQNNGNHITSSSKNGLFFRKILNVGRTIAKAHKQQSRQEIVDAPSVTMSGQDYQELMTATATASTDTWQHQSTTTNATRRRNKFNITSRNQNKLTFRQQSQQHQHQSIMPAREDDFRNDNEDNMQNVQRFQSRISSLGDGSTWNEEEDADDDNDREQHSNNLSLQSVSSSSSSNYSESSVSFVQATAGEESSRFSDGSSYITGYYTYNGDDYSSAYSDGDTFGESTIVSTTYASSSSTNRSFFLGRFGRYMSKTGNALVGMVPAAATYYDRAFSIPSHLDNDDGGDGDDNNDDADDNDDDSPSVLGDVEIPMSPSAHSSRDDKYTEEDIKNDNRSRQTVDCHSAVDDRVDSFTVLQAPAKSNRAMAGAAPYSSTSSTPVGSSVRRALGRHVSSTSNMVTASSSTSLRQEESTIVIAKPHVTSVGNVESLIPLRSDPLIQAVEEGRGDGNCATAMDPFQPSLRDDHSFFDQGFEVVAQPERESKTLLEQKQQQQHLSNPNYYSSQTPNMDSECSVQDVVECPDAKSMDASLPPIADLSVFDQGFEVVARLDPVADVVVERKGEVDHVDNGVDVGGDDESTVPSVILPPTSSMRSGRRQPMTKTNRSQTTSLVQTSSIVSKSGDSPEDGDHDGNGMEAQPPPSWTGRSGPIPTLRQEHGSVSSSSSQSLSSSHYRAPSKTQPRFNRHGLGGEDDDNDGGVHIAVFRDEISTCSKFGVERTVDDNIALDTKMDLISAPTTSRRRVPTFRDETSTCSKFGVERTVDDYVSSTDRKMKPIISAPTTCHHPSASKQPPVSKRNDTPHENGDGDVRVLVNAPSSSERDRNMTASSDKIKETKNDVHEGNDRERDGTTCAFACPRNVPRRKTKATQEVVDPETNPTKENDGDSVVRERMAMTTTDDGERTETSSFGFSFANPCQAMNNVTFALPSRTACLDDVEMLLPSPTISASCVSPETYHAMTNPATACFTPNVVQDEDKDKDNDGVQAAATSRSTSVTPQPATTCLSILGEQEEEEVVGPLREKILMQRFVDDTLSPCTMVFSPITEVLGLDKFKLFQRKGGITRTLPVDDMNVMDPSAQIEMVLNYGSSQLEGQTSKKKKSKKKKKGKVNRKEKATFHSMRQVPLLPSSSNEKRLRPSLPRTKRFTHPLHKKSTAVTGDTASTAVAGQSAQQVLWDQQWPDQVKRQRYRTQKMVAVRKKTKRSKGSNMSTAQERTMTPTPMMLRMTPIVEEVEEEDDEEDRHP